LLSDGYQDQFGGPKGRRKFGSRRLRELLQSVSHLPMPEQGKILEQQLENWMAEGQQKQLDDISLVGVRL
jgi:serine phosphatase RsbU (regulator of sigma subunit)